MIMEARGGIVSAMPKSKRIYQMPLADRPREKLLKKGALALSDFELLEVLIGNGNAGTDVGSLARHIQKVMRQSTVVTHESLTAIRGVSTATAGKILAALELAKRHLLRDVEPLLTQQDILARLGDIRAKQQEYLVCLSLDGGQRLIAQRTITVGTLNAVLAHPREVYADAIADRAASIILAHNHPSNDVRPSRQDITLTQDLRAAGQLLGIPLKDHLILGKAEFFSFREHHLL